MSKIVKTSFFPQKYERKNSIFKKVSNKAFLENIPEVIKTKYLLVSCLSWSGKQNLKFYNLI